MKYLAIDILLLFVYLFSVCTPFSYSHPCRYFSTLGIYIYIYICIYILSVRVKQRGRFLFSRFCLSRFPVLYQFPTSSFLHFFSPATPVVFSLAARPMFHQFPRQQRFQFSTSIPLPAFYHFFPRRRLQ